MRLLPLILALAVGPSVWLTVLAPEATAQNAPLVADPGQDQFEFCKQLYRQANGVQDPSLRANAYLRAIPRLNAYLQRFPKHANTAAATYYLGECYYHSGSLDDGKRVLHSVINRDRKGRYRVANLIKIKKGGFS